MKRNLNMVKSDESDASTTLNQAEKETAAAASSSMTPSLSNPKASTTTAMTMPKTSDPSPSVAPLKPHQPQAQPTPAMLQQRSSSPFLAGPSTSAGPTLSAIAGGASSLLLKLGVQQRHSLSPARYPPGLQQQQQHYPQQEHLKVNDASGGCFTESDIL